MKTELKQLPQSQVELLIELDPIEWGKFVERAIRQLSNEIKIEGFRPGHAPRALIEQKVGLGKILEEAADLAVRRTYLDAVKEKNLEIIGQPEIQVLKVAENNPFEFKIKAAVMPEVKLGNYQEIVKKEKIKDKSEIKVEEKEIEQSLAWLQKSRTKYVTVNRQAQTGDRVEVDFAAKQGNQIIDGGQGQNHSLILGEGKFVPGFEENLLGMKENEEKKFNLKFPDKYHEPKLAGQPADFETKVKLVQEAQKPEINDEFAKSLGRFDDLAALKKSLGEGILAEKEQKEKEIWRNRVLENIAKKTEIDLPEILVQAESEKMFQEFASSISQMGLKIDVYLENIKKTKEELKKEWQDKARDRVTFSLILRAIAEKENIEVSLPEAEEETSHLLSHYPAGELEKLQIDKERLLDYTKGRLRNEKVFEFLEKILANQ